MPGADSWLRSPHLPAEVPVRPLEDTHTGTHTLPGITGRVTEPYCRRNRAGVFPGPLPGIRARKDQSANRTPPLLLNVLLSQSNSSLWGMRPICRGGSTVEPQARAQSWSQPCPVSPVRGGPQAAPLLLGACPPLVERREEAQSCGPPRAMRRGLVKAPLWGHKRQNGRRGPHD